MSSAAPLPQSRRTPVTPGGYRAIRVEYVLDSVDDDYRDVLIVKFIGTYAIGHAGSPDATYMQAMVRVGEMCFHPSAVVLDLSELSYQWGDDMEGVFGPDCPHAVAVRAVVVGPPSREAIGTLLFGVHSTTPATEHEGFFEDVDAAVAYVRRRIGEPRFRPPPNGEPLTEAQWLESREPYDMWEWLVYDVPNRRWSMNDWPRTDRASDRKLLLFAVACCRRMWHLMDGRSRRAVEAAERAADAGTPHEPGEAGSDASAASRPRRLPSPPPPRRRGSIPLSTASPSPRSACRRRATPSSSTTKPSPRPTSCATSSATRSALHRT